MSKTQLESAKAGIITEEMKAAAIGEPLTAEQIRDFVAKGWVVIPKNKNRSFPQVKAIGKGLRTKVNANLGTSDEKADLEFERKKLEAAIKAGADSVMDLSTGGDLNKAREFFLENSPVMVGTVPIYHVASEMAKKGKKIEDMTEETLFESIERQCQQGVDYITVHCGVNSETAARLKYANRIMPCVSRGGSITLRWMKKNKKENPLYEHFDELLEIAHRYDVTLSLGDGFRPGTIMDAIDGPQISELLILGELAKRAWERGVQVIIEGPGHVPLEHIRSHVKLEKKLCHEAPFYVLGPLPTDIAPGYDHITAAIGGAEAAAAGVDFLCYVTPAEHLGLPDEKDVYLGVISARIAAHVGDISKGIPTAKEKDRAMSIARQNLDWETMAKHALDGNYLRCRAHIAQDKEACSMCGKLCAVKLARMKD